MMARVLILCGLLLAACSPLPAQVCAGLVVADHLAPDDWRAVIGAAFEIGCE